MKLYTAQKKHNTQINIASLIDVVFLLIIFFMAVSHITTTEAIPLDLPEADTALDVLQSTKDNLIINIDTRGRVFIESQSYSAAQLESLLTGLKANAADTKITIRSDRKTQWSKVRSVMSSCTMKGFSNKSVRVIEES